MARPSKNALKTTTSLSEEDRSEINALLNNEDAQGSAETKRDYIVRLGSTIRNNEGRAKQCHRLSMAAFCDAAFNGDIVVSEDNSEDFDTLWKDWKWGPGAHLALDVSTRSELARYRTAAIAATVAKVNKAPSISNLADRVRETFNAVKAEAKAAKPADRVSPIQYERAFSKIATFVKDNKGQVSDAKIREIVRGDDVKKAATTTATTTTGNPVIAAAETLLKDIEALLKVDAPADLKVKLRQARADIENAIEPLRVTKPRNDGDGASAAA